MNSKAIFIVGAGAIGKALAAFLKSEGKEVVLLRGHLDDHSAYTEQIEVVLKNSEVIKAEVPVSTISNYSELNGLVVLTNKSYGNAAIAQRLKAKINATPIVILQNGLNVEKPFIEHKFPQIYRCVLFATSQLLSENKLQFMPVSDSSVGIISGNTEGLLSIVNEINTQHFKFKTEPNIYAKIWSKTIVNCVFNSVCPLLEIDNGIFYRNSEALSIAKRVINECIAVAATQGILLSSEEVINSLLLISQHSDGQLISTYQDIINKRKTEIDTLNVAIATIANNLQEKKLAKETSLLGELIQIKSQIALSSLSS